MSKGEKAQLEIEPEWAYGKKGQPDAKYPSMSTYTWSNLERPGGAKRCRDRDITGGSICLGCEQRKRVQQTSWVGATAPLC